MQLTLLVSIFAATAVAVPTILHRNPVPGTETVNPAAITGTTCTDKAK